MTLVSFTNFFLNVFSVCELSESEPFWFVWEREDKALSLGEKSFGKGMWCGEKKKKITKPFWRVF